MIKKDFIVRRTITEIEGKPHAETYSEEELVRCKDCQQCKQQEGKEPWLSCLHLKMTTTPYWFCADGVMKNDDSY